MTREHSPTSESFWRSNKSQSSVTADQHGIIDSVQNRQKPLFSIANFGGAIGQSRGREKSFSFTSEQDRNCAPCTANKEVRDGKTEKPGAHPSKGILLFWKEFRKPLHASFTTKFFRTRIVLMHYPVTKSDYNVPISIRYTIEEFLLIWSLPSAYSLRLETRLRPSAFWVWKHCYGRVGAFNFHYYSCNRCRCKKSLLDTSFFVRSAKLLQMLPPKLTAASDDDIGLRVQ
ncbi:hypothetical protein Y032_0042g715 [Ancylostoma ceylanicum]|uniref:Uncharacterized protein n=1 Tax=Ancylostoma ceylanicum TaxID=53326 RepID=A0A016UHN1_9BILA|nr:hypothetical protein Y032_0042g715 [Ancylostoma ceylanicum]